MEAAESRFRFDKVMTNGVWQTDAGHLEATLTALRDAGFTGKLGLSVDKFHGIQTEALAEFCHVARRVFRRDDILSLSYASRAPHLGLDRVRGFPLEVLPVQPGPQ